MASYVLLIFIKNKMVHHLLFQNSKIICHQSLNFKNSEEKGKGGGCALPIHILMRLTYCYYFIIIIFVLLKSIIILWYRRRVFSFSS